jgi:hypothetical protein
MPSTINQPANANSFLGLQSYTEAQSNLFFGRDAETDTLTSLIGLNTLTIVFGRSGTGKTSLLNAGVFPRLRKSFCLPFRIRLEFNDNSPDLITQVKKVLKEEIDKYGFKVESYPSSETLWEYFHKEPLWKTVTPILVFDQFEEIFTLAKSNLRFASIELPAFWEEMSDLIENNIPEKLKPKFLDQKDKIEYNYKKQKAKIVFSFREEYLPEFESITSKIPSLKYSRFRLLPMNGNQAYEVITKTWNDKINPAEARHIVSYFTNVQGLDDYNLITVEPSLLSQVCTYIDKERIESGGGKVSAELLNKYPKETILRSIYEETISEANNSLIKGKDDNRNLIKEFVEEKLITTEGYRSRYNLGTSDDPIRPGINVLAAKYFVREDDEVVELTHDVIAPIIKVDREKRRNMIAMAEERRKAKEKQKKYIRYAFAIAGLIFTIFFILSFIANQKRLEEERLRNLAYRERENVNKEILGLKSVVDSLKSDSARLARSGKIKIIYRDTTINKFIHDTIYQFKDSPYLIDSITHLKYIILVLKDSLNKKETRIKKITDTLIVYSATKQIDEGKYNDLKKKYEELLREIENLRRQLADCIRKCQFPTPPNSAVDTSKCLKLELNYSNKADYYPSLLPDKLNIYLIPYTQKNMALIKEASNYYQVDESRLEQAEGRVKAQYNAPYFIFSNLKSGQKYLIKISTLYGNYLVYNRTTDNCETKKIDAVPAVRGKHR